MRAGALPSLNLGKKEKRPPKPRELSIKRSLEKDLSLNTPTSYCKKVKTEEIIVHAPKDLKFANIIEAVTECSQASNDIPKINETENPALPLFQQIVENNILVPESWAKSNVSWNGINCITFMTLIVYKDKNGKVDTF